MRNCIFSLATISTLSGSASAWTNRRGGGINRVSGGVINNTPSSSIILSIRGGANEYETKYESAKCSAIEKASRKVSVGLFDMSIAKLHVSASHVHKCLIYHVHITSHNYYNTSIINNNTY